MDSTAAGVRLPINVPVDLQRVNRKRREFIPEIKKDEKYWIKRRKNNEAAKKSRDKRRMNDAAMGKNITELKHEKARLKAELKAIKEANGLDVNQVFPYNEADVEKYKKEYPHISLIQQDEQIVNGSLGTPSECVRGPRIAGNSWRVKDVTHLSDGSRVPVMMQVGSNQPPVAYIPVILPENSNISDVPPSGISMNPHLKDPRPMFGLPSSCLDDIGGGININPVSRRRYSVDEAPSSSTDSYDVYHTDRTYDERYRYTYLHDRSPSLCSTSPSDPWQPEEDFNSGILSSPLDLCMKSQTGTWQEQNKNKSHLESELEIKPDPSRL